MENKILLLLLVLLIIPVACADLEVSPLLLKTITKTGLVAQEFVKIKNLGLDTVPVQITTQDANFKLSSYGFGLLPGEETILDFRFSTGSPGVFVNKFFIRSEGSTHVLPVVVEVETSNVKFDSTVEILEAKKMFYPGEEVSFSFTVFDLFGFIPTDAEMSYYILDMKNTLVYDYEEVVNVKAQKTLSRKAELPEDLAHGKYVLVVKSRHGTSIGFSTLLFNVVEKPVMVEEWDVKSFCYALIGRCLDDSTCISVTASVILVILAALIVYLIEVVKLGRLPKKKIERAIKHEERKKRAISLTKKILKEAEEQKQEREKEGFEEVKRKKIIEDMLLKKGKSKLSMMEKKLFEREIKHYLKDRKNVLKEKKEELKRQKKIKKLLGRKR